MPQVTFQAGAKFFLPDHDDMKRAAQEAIAADREFEHARGIKVMKLPILSGSVVSSAITLGVTKGQIVGPQQGYAWSVMKLVVTGLTASSSSPDIVNFYLNDPSGPIWWQLNGNSFGETFGKLHMVMMPGDTLALQNSGSLAATGTISVSGLVIEVPAEQLYKLV